jgi:ATP-dependent Clp endopeptidase proteolytic subunit ClpP
MRKIFHTPSRAVLFNGPADSARPWFTVKNEAHSNTAEILIYDQIGKDWWTNEGTGAKDFAESLKAIPANRNILVRINSPGGNVWDGLAIYHQLQARKDYVTCCVDGVAASIASIIALAGKELVMPRSSLLMIHDPTAMAMGSADDMRAAADMLDKHKDLLADIYASKSGQPHEDIKARMSDETWFTGYEAEDYGLCDRCTDEIALAANFNLSSFRRVPAAIGKPNTSTAGGSGEPQNIMDRTQIMALLKKHGVEVANDISDKDLQAKLDEVLAKIAKPAATPPPAQNVVDLSAINNEIAELRKQRDAEKRTRVSARVRELQPNRFPIASVEKWIERAMADESVIDELAGLPVQNIGAEPVRIDITSTDPKDIEKGVLQNFGGSVLTPDAAMERGKVRAHIINKHMAQLMPVMNTNTISADLKRTVILQQMIRAFAIKILPLSAFSTALNAPRLEGTDKIAVPYFPLITTASTDFVAGNGYDTFANTNSDAKALTVDKRKYLGINWTSSQLARQPFMDIGMAAMLIAEQLGLDVVNDVLSLITTATYGASVKAEPAGSFDSDDVADLKGVADLANWPSGGRSLLLNSTYDVNLLKDTAVKNAMAFGDNAPVREGRISRLMGFDYIPDSRIPSNSENLEGLIAYKSGLLVGFSPIGPTEEVRNLLTQYEVVVEPVTGAVFEYRRFGSAVLDTSYQTIESNYGRVAGETAAIKRITNQ